MGVGGSGLWKGEGAEGKVQIETWIPLKRILLASGGEEGDRLVGVVEAGESVALRREATLGARKLFHDGVIAVAGERICLSESEALRTMLGRVGDLAYLSWPGW